MAFALSTSWNASRHRDAGALLFEIKELGFKQVELSFNLTSSMTKEASRAARDLGMRVLSLHNYCPIPDGMKREEALPDCYSMASADPQERRLAVKFTKRTVETAESLGARAVVLHCGRLDLPERTRALIGLYEKGLRNSRQFEDLKKDILKERGLQRGPFLDNTLKSLEEINRFAESRKILLGIETRFYCREIPALEEIGLILEKFSGSNIFYWHDIGHAQLMENLGIARHKDFLELYADKMLGMHLHDIEGCLDHKSPSQGKFDFSLVLPYLKKDTLKVIEAHHPSTAGQIKEGKLFLERILNEPA